MLTDSRQVVHAWWGGAADTAPRAWDELPTADLKWNGCYEPNTSLDMSRCVIVSVYFLTIKCKGLVILQQQTNERLTPNVSASNLPFRGSVAFSDRHPAGGVLKSNSSCSSSSCLSGRCDSAVTIPQADVCKQRLGQIHNITLVRRRVGLVPKLANTLSHLALV